MRLFSQKKLKRFLRHLYKPLFQCYNLYNIWSLYSSSTWERTAETNLTCLGGYYSMEFLVTTCFKLKILCGEGVKGKVRSALTDTQEAKERDVSILTKLAGSFMSVKFYLFSRCLAVVEGTSFSSLSFSGQSAWMQLFSVVHLTAVQVRKWMMRLIPNFMGTS